MIHTGCPGDVDDGAVADDDVAQARHMRAGLVDDGLGGDDAAATERAVDRDDRLGPRIVEARGDRLRAPAPPRRLTLATLRPLRSCRW
jgi:hypothetical protein